MEDHHWHHLKVWPDSYEAIATGRRTADVRRRDERDFQMGWPGLDGMAPELAVLSIRRVRIWRGLGNERDEYTVAAHDGGEPA